MLQINQSDLVVRVPSKNVELVGVRDVVGKEGLEKVFSVLREIDVEEVGNWSRRYKANQERLASGDINKVAEVVRDLWRRDQDRGLSAGEKRMLAKARQILVGELALASPVDEKKADTMLEEIDATIERHRAAGIVEDKSITTDIDNDIDPMTSPSTTKTNKPVVALIAAAGMGTRLGAEVPKAYVELQGRTLLERSVAAMAHSGVVKRAVVTVSPVMEDTARALLADAPCPSPSSTAAASAPTPCGLACKPLAKKTPWCSSTTPPAP